MRYQHGLIRLDFRINGRCDVYMPSRGVIRDVAWNVEANPIAGVDGKQMATLYPTLLVESEVDAERKKRRFIAVDRSGVIDSADYGSSRLRFVGTLHHPETQQPILIYEAPDFKEERVSPVADDRPVPVSGEIVVAP